ncbi:MAG TPA: cellulose binding domain-containing protein, partial [Streptosporangiaceae bacterium]|nr:cellulose binding domain-containing protein [Streptosporangiaceae bacterium]
RRPPPGIGLNRPVPPAPWYRRRWWLLAIVAGLTAVICAGFLEMPPLLAAVGIDAPTACQLCQFPLPSSPPVSQATGASPAMSASAPPPARTATPSASASPPVRVVAPQPTATTPHTPPTVSATYTATPAGGSSFTGQITVINRGKAAITSWNLVVALPGDTVSGVQNAEFTDDNDVLFMTPAPYDLSISPNSTATITIYASGPDPAPAECSFNNVACQ